VTVLGMEMVRGLSGLVAMTLRGETEGGVPQRAFIPSKFLPLHDFTLRSISMTSLAVHRLIPER